MTHTVHAGLHVLRFGGQLSRGGGEVGDVASLTGPGEPVFENWIRRDGRTFISCETQGKLLP